PTGLSPITTLSYALNSLPSCPSFCPTSSVGSPALSLDLEHEANKRHKTILTNKYFFITTSGFKFNFIYLLFTARSIDTSAVFTNIVLRKANGFHLVFRKQLQLIGIIG